MKKFFISFVLIISLLFNVFADNKQAHKELREVFENSAIYPKLIEKGFSLDNLDKIDDWKEMRDYLQPFFIDENGMPLDNHASISFYEGKKYLGKVNANSQMFIEWSDEYGSKNELLKKGYKEDEIFYYPYFNGEWKDGYRVGKKFMGKSYRIYHISRCFSDESKNALLVGIKDFRGGSEFDGLIDKISNSKKKYLILDLSYNGGGHFDNYLMPLYEAINKMKPKKVFIMSDYTNVSCGESCISNFENYTNIKPLVVGYPSTGAYITVGSYEIIYDDYTINIKIGIKNLHNEGLIEGIGITPDIYADNSIESLEVIKHLIKDDELSLPKDYIEDINRTKHKKWN